MHGVTIGTVLLMPDPGSLESQKRKCRTSFWQCIDLPYVVCFWSSVRAKDAYVSTVSRRTAFGEFEGLFF